MNKKKKPEPIVKASAELIAFARWFPGQVEYFWNKVDKCIGVRKIAN